jgi:hypothetical protein
VGAPEQGRHCAKWIVRPALREHTASTPAEHDVAREEKVECRLFTELSLQIDRIDEIVRARDVVRAHVLEQMR